MPVCGPGHRHVTCLQHETPRIYGPWRCASAMSDAGRPRHAALDSGGGYLDAPADVLPELEALLKRHDVSYEIDEQTISLNDGPYVATVNFGRKTDVRAVQAVLDGSK